MVDARLRRVVLVSAVATDWVSDMKSSMEAPAKSLLVLNSAFMIEALSSSFFFLFFFLSSMEEVFVGVFLANFWDDLTDFLDARDCVVLEVETLMLLPLEVFLGLAFFTLRLAGDEDSIRNIDDEAMAGADMHSDNSSEASAVNPDSSDTELTAQLWLLLLECTARMALPSLPVDDSLLMLLSFLPRDNGSLGEERSIGLHVIV